MRDEENDIEVWIEPTDGGPRYYDWYASPESPLHLPRKNVCYIAAGINERYGIHARIGRGFDSKDASHIGVFYSIDGNHAAGVWLHSPTGDRARYSRLDHLQASIDGPTIRWLAIGFGETKLGTELTLKLASGQLTSIDEELELGEEQEQLELFHRGRIDVMIQRGAIGEARIVPAGGPLRLFPAISSKKVVKEMGKCRTLKYVVDA